MERAALTSCHHEKGAAPCRAAPRAQPLHSGLLNVPREASSELASAPYLTPATAVEPATST